jgi:hypothetical protein
MHVASGVLAQVAAMRGQKDALRALLKAGLSWDLRDRFDRTALDYICMHRWAADGRLAEVMPPDFQCPPAARGARRDP